MVLLRPGSQVTVVPQRPAETVKPRKKEKNTIVEKKEQDPAKKDRSFRSHQMY